MKTVLFAMIAAFLLMGTVVAQGPQTAPAQAPQSQTPGGARAGQPAGRGPGSFGPPPELGPDDKQAVPDPPAGFNVRREDT
ncbi:MAG: hypothetical protein LAQ69_50895 [Acidobacteriia bacterium]|nr:hypothetical protein [Terriglobia bacterium]